MGVRRWHWLVALVMAVAACDSGGSNPTVLVTTTTATTSTHAATTTAATTTTVAIVGVDSLALPVAGDEMGPGWVEEIFIPYGDTEDTLGTSPGGEGGTMDLGPEFGAQGPDGVWWFLDAAKTRIARYSSDGTFLDALPIPEAILVDGVYFQFQLPRVLADGRLVAFGLRNETTVVLRATGGVIDQVELPDLVVPRADDGFGVYGFDDSGVPQLVDPVEGWMVPAAWFVSQYGARFLLEMTDSGLHIQLFDAPIPVDRVLPLVTAADEGVPAFGSIEVATTADGRIHLLLVGASSADETTQLGGYFTILPDGTVTPVVAIRNPFTLSDPGSPAHLGAAYGALEPWFMVVDLDGVRVYRPGEG